MSSINVLQISDTHLFSSPDGKLCGMKTNHSLKAVLRMAASSENWPPDVVLATGDLSQDMTSKSYERFRRILEKLNAPVFCLPGNHDVPGRMWNHLIGGRVQASRQMLSGRWQILLLDSTIPHKNGGHLGKGELSFLDQCLADHVDLHTLVCLHHNLLPTGTKWLDTMTLNNANEFFRVLDRHSNVRGILHGHVHQETASTRKGIPIYSAPSTCIQFLPASTRFSLDTAAPGYRWLKLKSDGKIETAVERLSSYKFTPDLSSKGY